MNNDKLLLMVSPEICRMARRNPWPVKYAKTYRSFEDFTPDRLAFFRGNSYMDGKSILFLDWIAYRPIVNMVKGASNRPYQSFGRIINPAKPYNLVQMDIHHGLDW